MDEVRVHCGARARRLPARAVSRPRTAAPPAAGRDAGGDLAPGRGSARRLAVNLGSNAAYFVLSTLLMLWYVPFLVRHLGVAAYGMVPLAHSLVMYAVVVSDGLQTAIYCHLAIHLNRGDGPAARRTFDAAALLTLAACALLAVPFAGFTLVLPRVLDVPPHLAGATQFLFAGTALAMTGGILSGLFGTPSVVLHRFDLRNIARGAALATRVGVPALCFALWPASLWHVGLGLVASVLVGLACEILVWRRLTPGLRFAPQAAERKAMRPLLGLGGWSSANMLGCMVLMQTDLVLVNLLFGPETTGRYGALLLFPILIHAMAETVVPVLSPMIMARYAAGDTRAVRDLVTRSVRLLAVGLALPAGLLCGLGGPALTLWLGPEAAAMGTVLALLVGHLAVNLALRPVAYVLTAYGRMRAQALVTLALGLAYLPLAVMLARWAGWGAAGVAAAGALVWTAKNAGFLALLCASALGMRWRDLGRPALGGAVGVAALWLAGHLVLALWPSPGWFWLAGLAALLSLAYAPLAWILLDAADRTLARGLLARLQPRKALPC
ncbi:lipopolysaccharide biosynthesis protein [Methylorubrum extorquens]